MLALSIHAYSKKDYHIDIVKNQNFWTYLLQVQEEIKNLNCLRTILKKKCSYTKTQISKQA